MGKKMSFTLTSLFKPKDTRPTWPWPSCKSPRTESFRVGHHAADDDVIKTVNSVYLDTVTTSESGFTNSSESGSFSTASQESLETVMRGVRSDRFFFEPGETKSIVEESVKGCGGPPPFEESIVLALESNDPYVDFRESMEEMVEAHGLRDWECLEELLHWYLSVNGKKTHGYIVGAFVDLLVGIVLSSAIQSSEKRENVSPL